MDSLNRLREGSTGVLKQAEEAYCVVYADDILIAGPKPECVRLLLSVVLQVLGFLGCLVSPEKIQAPATSVRVMGLRLEDGILRPDPDMVDRIKAMKAPTDKEGVRKVIGLLQYVAGFVEVQRWFALSPLQELLSNRTPFRWGPEEQEAWRILVEQFASLPISHFSLREGEEDLRGETLVLQTDASDEAYGGAVWVVRNTEAGQMKVAELARNGDARLIEMYHRRFTPQEKRYPAHDREGMGLFSGLVRMRSLIHLFIKSGRPVVVLSDNICALARMGKFYGEDISLTRSRRWLRWQSELADISPFVTFAHISGNENGVADWLSRSTDQMMGVCEIAVQTEPVSDGFAMMATRDDAMDAEVPAPREEMRYLSRFAHEFGEWSMDASDYCGLSLKDIYEHLRFEKPVPTRLARLAKKRFAINDTGCLMFKCGSRLTVVVPDYERPAGGKLRNYIVQLVHEAGFFSCHRGTQCTLSRVREHFWWPNMDRLVTDWCRSCETCVASRIGHIDRAGVHTGKVISEPNERVLFDFMQVRGSFVLVAVDCFSNFMMARQVLAKDAANVAEFILEWCGLFGRFQLWSSDWEPVFVSAVVRQLRSYMRIEEFMGTTYSPATQGQVERAVGTIKAAVEACADRRLVHVIHAVTFVNNSSARPGFAGLSPGEAFLGRKMLDVELAFTEELVTNDIVATTEDVRGYWRSRINEIRQQTSDEALAAQSGLVNLEPGTTVLRVVLDYSVAKPKIKKYGLYRVLRAHGTGYFVEPVEAGGDPTEEWIAGHQLCVFDSALGQELRRGLSTGSRRVFSEPGTAMKVGETWAFKWETDVGIRLFCGKIVDIAETDCGVRYYDSLEGGRWGQLERNTTRTALAAAVSRGRVHQGRWIPSRHT